MTLAALESRQSFGHLMAELAIGGKTYTVEFRARAGWDAGIPQHVVLVHEIRSGVSFLLPTRGVSFGAGQIWQSVDKRVRVRVSSVQGAAGNATVTIEDTTVDVSPQHLVFRDQKRSTTSPSQNVIVSNNSAAPLAIGPITVPANFAASGCGSVLATGTTCAVSVSYSPGAAGKHGGVVSIPHDLSPIPLQITLEGWTAEPKISLSPASLSLSSRVGSLASGVITVQNVGAGTLTIRNAWVTDRGGDPAQWNAWDFQIDTSNSTCLTNPQVQVWGTCTINVGFLSNINGTFDARLFLETDAPTSTDKILLSGTAATPSLSLTPPSLDFGYLPFGGSKTMQVTLANGSSVPVAVNSVQASGGSYNISTNPCLAQLKPGASCTVSVTFSPAGNWLLRGTLVVSTDAPASPHLVELIGFGNPMLSARRT